MTPTTQIIERLALEMYKCVEKKLVFAQTALCR